MCQSTSTLVSGGCWMWTGEGPFWSFLPWEIGFSQPELNQKNCGVILGRSGFPLVIIVHIKPNDTHNPLSHQIVGYMMLYVITATPKQDRKVFPGRYRCTMMYFIFPEIFPGFPLFNPFHTFLSVFMGLPFEPPHRKNLVPKQNFPTDLVIEFAPPLWRRHHFLDVFRLGR